MSKLKKTRTVHEYADRTEATVYFWLAADDDLTIPLSIDKWEDMGRPEYITVTVEPGDQLNKDNPTTVEVRCPAFGGRTNSHLCKLDDGHEGRHHCRCGSMWSVDKGAADG